jgi:hypothetical protein
MSKYGWFRLSKRHVWHEVESAIDGDQVTYCGRRLARRKGDETTDKQPLSRCLVCP